MKVLILNSGIGRRMGSLTESSPKCLVTISEKDTILSRQLRLIESVGVADVIITTGMFKDQLEEYCNSLKLPLKYNFVFNKEYARTNYIYSIYCARKWLKDDDVILMHGDLVFEAQILNEMIDFPYSCMAVSSNEELSQKDFKVVLDKGNITKVGVGFFENAISAQPLYKLKRKDWSVWWSRSREDGTDPGIDYKYSDRARWLFGIYRGWRADERGK